MGVCGSCCMLLGRNPAGQWPLGRCACALATAGCGALRAQTLSHALLISELVSQLKFQAKPADLKKRIERRVRAPACASQGNGARRDSA